MRRLSAVFTVAIMALAVTGVAQAGVFDAANSTFALSLGGINNHPISAQSSAYGKVILVDNGMGGHDLVIAASVWSTINFSFGTSLYTGIPIIDDFELSVVNNPVTATSSFTALNYLSNSQMVIGPGLGGTGHLSGSLYLIALGGRAVDFPLDGIGGEAGGVITRTALGVTISNTYMPWVTRAAPITGITTNIISYDGVTGAGITMRITPSQDVNSLSTGGGFVSTAGGLPLEYHTVTISGDNQLQSASMSGLLTIVSPIRINTTPAISGRVPAAAWLDIVFVPEPGTMLLLVTGAIGLVAIGRRRTRK